MSHVNTGESVASDRASRQGAWIMTNAAVQAVWPDPATPSTWIVTIDTFDRSV
jgi:hypothetical protein